MARTRLTSQPQTRLLLKEADMAKDYDLVVIGGGTAARGVAMRCRAAGWRVALIEYRPLGGTCALRGCDPKKMLISGAQALEAARLMRGHGVEGELSIDWPELIAFKRSFTDAVPKKQEASYAEKGVDVYHGRARFTGRHSLEVNGHTLDTRHTVIATGAKPMPLPIEGAEHLIDNEAFLNLEQLPKRIVLVGGGYIAAEFAHIAARAGAKVTILQRGPRMLKGFDPDLVGWLMEKFDEIGVNVRTNSEAKAIEKVDNGYRVTVSGEGAEETIEADLVVHAAGRIPDIDELNLEAAQVEVVKGHLALNEFLQSTSNPSVYAAGDANSMGPALTPVSAHDAKIVVANLLEGQGHRPNYHGVPSAAFTLPPITRVGLSEEEAKEKGLKFRVNSQRTSDWYSNRRVRESVAGYKVLVEEGSERILGAHLLGPHADEVINLFALVMRQGLTTSAIKETMFAYPTGASDIGYMV
jgi:glutathione reductase (NADPH)